MKGPPRWKLRNLQAAARASRKQARSLPVIRSVVKRPEGNGCPGGGRSGSSPLYLGPCAKRSLDISILLEAARRGAFVELDLVGAPYQSQPELLAMAVGADRSRFCGATSCSHTMPAGTIPAARMDCRTDGYRGYTALMENFIPELLKHGVTEEQLHLITVNNPANAFAF